MFKLKIKMKIWRYKMKKILVIDDDLGRSSISRFIGCFFGIDVNWFYLKKLDDEIRWLIEGSKNPISHEDAMKEVLGQKYWLATKAKEGLEKSKIDFSSVNKILVKIGNLFSPTHYYEFMNLINKIDLTKKEKELVGTSYERDEIIELEKMVLRLFAEIGKEMDLRIDILSSSYGPSFFEVAENFCQKMDPGSYDIILLDLGFDIPPNKVPKFSPEDMKFLRSLRLKADNHCPRSGDDYRDTYERVRLIQYLDDDFGRLLLSKSGGVEIGKILRERKIPFIIWTNDVSHATNNLYLSLKEGLITEETFLELVDVKKIPWEWHGRLDNVICHKKTRFIPDSLADEDLTDEDKKSKIKEVLGYLKELIG